MKRTLLFTWILLSGGMLHAEIPFQHEVERPEALTESIRTWWRASDKLGALNPETLDFLFEHLSDERVSRATRSSGWNVPRKAALEVLGGCSNPIEARLEKTMGHEDPLLRRSAIELLSIRKGFTGARIDRLFQAASDPEEAVRAQAAEALAHLPERHEAAAEQLIKLLKAQDRASNIAARSVGTLAPNLSQATLLRLSEVLFDMHASTRYGDLWPLITLRVLMPRLPEAKQRELVDRTIPLLQPGRQLDLRVALIGSAGPRAEKAIPHLHRLLAAADPDDRAIFAAHLWKVEQKPESVYNIFLQAIQSEDGSERHYGFEGLELMGPAARKAVPKLKQLLLHEKKTIRRGVLRTLTGIGPAASEALPQIHACLESPDETEQKLAQAALDTIRVH